MDLTRWVREYTMYGVAVLALLFTGALVSNFVSEDWIVILIAYLVFVVFWVLAVWTEDTMVNKRKGTE